MVGAIDQHQRQSIHQAAAVAYPSIFSVAGSTPNDPHPSSSTTTHQSLATIPVNSRSSIVTSPIVHSPSNPPIMSLLLQQNVHGPVHARQDAPPPSYEDVVDLKCDPPSYDSLFESKWTKLKLETSNVCDNFCDVICCVIIPLAIPVLMIIFGSVYLHECPVQPNIPIFLIVGGTLLAFKYLLHHFCQLKMLKEWSDGPVQHLITFFLCCWFVAGCFWVFFSLKNHRWNYMLNPIPENYCHDVVYSVAFMLLLGVGMVGLSLVIMWTLACLCGACGR